MVDLKVLASASVREAAKAAPKILSTALKQANSPGKKQGPGEQQPPHQQPPHFGQQSPPYYENMYLPNDPSNQHPPHYPPHYPPPHGTPGMVSPAPLPGGTMTPPCAHCTGGYCNGGHHHHHHGPPHHHHGPPHHHHGPPHHHHPPPPHHHHPPHHQMPCPPPPQAAYPPPPQAYPQPYGAPGAHRM